MFLMGKRHVDGGRYLAGIDGLRAIAVGAVMIFHLVPWILPGGFVGVDVFFVISGYVVTGSMIRHNNLPFGQFIAGFYARRFRRIVPPLVFCLCVTVPLAFAVIPDAYLSMAIPKTALSAFFGVSNFALIATADGYFATPTSFNPFTHTWSLAVEEQFYLIFPLILFCALRSDRGRLALSTKWILAGLSIGSLAFCAWSTAYLPAVAYYTLPSRFWELSLGAAAAMAGEEKRRRLVDLVGHATMMNVGLALIAISCVMANERLFPIPWAIPGCVGALSIVLASGFAARRWSLGTLLQARAMTAVGLLSYSLYLWHWPIYTLMRWTTGLDRPALYAIALGLTVGMAWVSYLIVEYPTQNWKVFTQARAGTTIVAAIALTVAGYVVCDHPWGFKRTVVEKNRRDWYASAGGGDSAGRLCDVTETTDSDGFIAISPVRCAAQPSPHIFVIGDSHAGAYKRMMRIVASETGLSVTIASGIACNEADFLLPARARTMQCESSEPYSEKVLRRLKRGDIVFLASLRSVRLSDQMGLVPHDLFVSRTASDVAKQNRRAAETEANVLIGRLSAAGANVIIDLPKPVFRAPAFRCSDWFNRANPICSPGLTISRPETLANRLPLVDAIQRVAGAQPRVSVWDPLPTLCPDDPCTATRAGRPLFFDGDHLSGYANELLAPSFLKVIRELAPNVRATSVAPESTDGATR